MERSPLPIYLLFYSQEKKQSFAKKHLEFNSDTLKESCACLLIADSWPVDNPHRLPPNTNFGQPSHIPGSNISFVKGVYSHPPLKDNLSIYDSDGDSVVHVSSEDIMDS